MFETVSSGVAEEFDPGIAPAEVVRQLALRKAFAVAADYSDDVILGSDTIVVIAGTVLGIPRDRAHARSMLRQLSGATHEVHTGVAIIWGEHVQVESDVANVKFHSLSVDEINAYVSGGEGDDKAGAYAFQGDGRRLIEEITGDAQTVIGLPVMIVEKMLKQWKLQFKIS